MYTTKLLAGEDANPHDIKNPNWEQIKSSILALNGCEYRTIMIAKEYEEEGQESGIKESMEIAGGGANGLYVCIFCSEDDDYEWYLYDPSKSEEEIEIARTDPTMLPLATCFDLNTILVVAETYARYGERDKSFHWQGWPGSSSLPVKIESPHSE